VEDDADANATAISGLDTRVTNAEGTLSSQSTQLTQLESSVDGTHRWTRIYTVNNDTSTGAGRLRNADGSLLSTGGASGADRGSFTVEARTLGTGTQTGAVARFTYNGSSWSLEK